MDGADEALAVRTTIGVSLEPRLLQLQLTVESSPSVQPGAQERVLAELTGLDVANNAPPAPQLAASTMGWWSTLAPTGMRLP